MKWIIYIIFLLTPIIIVAQEDETEKKWAFRGYLKDMVTFNFPEDSSTFVDNLIHNRLNFEWFPSNKFNAYLEIRTRVFTGDLVQSIQGSDNPLIPGYAELIDVNNDYFDLSWTIIDEEKLVIHTMLDRAYVEWISGDWEIRAGRQRINWGTNLVWNPNDLFNAYSFFDFDYEERPGSDAIRIKRYTGFASSLEIAANIQDDFDDMVIAGMWKFNKKDYDIQILVGKARNDLVLGTGWAGNLGKAGIKGEITWFHPYNKEASEEAVLISLTGDYSFRNSLYLHGSVLYNSDGEKEPPTDFFLLESRRLTAKELSPYNFSTFFQTSYQFHPLLMGGIAVIYYPSNQDIFINPNVTVSISRNIDLDIIGQLFYGSVSSQALFTRLKWSF
jgi:hypothetical protein